MIINVKMFFPSHSKTSAFTLTEIIVAAVIMATAIAGLFASFIAAKRYTVASKDQLMAVHNAQYILERLKQYVRADTWNSPASYLSVDTHDVEGWLPNSGDSNTLVGKYGIGPVNAIYNVATVSGQDYREVVLTIQWPDMD